MNGRPGARLRQKVFERRGLIVPGAANALAARVIESLGFEAVYLIGAGLTNTFYALPDLGLISLADLAQRTSAIRGAVDLPIIVGADSGFGNALNVRPTVRTFESADASAIQSRMRRCQRSAATSSARRCSRRRQSLARSGRLSMATAATTS